MSTVLNHHARRRALRDLRPRAGHSGRLPAPRRARCHRVQLIPGAGGEWLVSNTHLLVDCFWALQLKIRMFPAHTELLIAEERACCFSELTASVIGKGYRFTCRHQQVCFLSFQLLLPNLFQTLGTLKK